MERDMMKILQKEKIKQKGRISINFDDLDDVDRPTLGRSV